MWRSISEPPTDGGGGDGGGWEVEKGETSRRKRSGWERWERLSFRNGIFLSYPSHTEGKSEPEKTAVNDIQQHVIKLN